MSISLYYEILIYINIGLLDHLLSIHPEKQAMFMGPVAVAKESDSNKLIKLLKIAIFATLTNKIRTPLKRHFKIMIWGIKTEITSQLNQESGSRIKRSWDKGVKGSRGHR